MLFCYSMFFFIMQVNKSNTEYALGKSKFEEDNLVVFLWLFEKACLFEPYIFNITTTVR